VASGRGTGNFGKAVSFAHVLVLGTVGPALSAGGGVMSRSRPVLSASQMVNGVGGDGKILMMVSTVAIVEVARGVHARIVAVVVALPAMVASRSADLGFISPVSTSSGWFGTSDSSSNAVMIHSGSTGPGSNYAHLCDSSSNGSVVSSGSNVMVGS
jgi:hypothetical protein